jgi:hypothetical protein
MARKAVLCGINNYEYAPLRGCINDVENIRRLLVEVFKFQPQNIHTLKDDQVIKVNVFKEWQWLTCDAQTGDTLVFHFSGHGSHVPDQNGDEQDLRDEISCLYDMDFNNPNTYLSDDEWYEMVQTVKPETSLLIIKDTCHSGGSTRFLGVRGDNGKDKIILADIQQMKDHTLDEVIFETKVTNARFLVPPDVPAEVWHTGGDRQARLGHVKETRLAQVVSQTSLMACMETQTAADAYIAGDYNGAFTYHLCEILRQNQQLNSQQLIDAVGQQLQGRYSQIPQHEGRTLAFPIFGSTDAATEVATTGTPVSNLVSLFPPKEASSPGAYDTQRILIQAHIKFLDIMAAMQGVLPTVAGTSRAGHRVLVAVHGISRHVAGYSNRWWQALAPFVGAMFEPSVLGQGRQEVLWSDLVNRRGIELARNIDTDQANELRQSILDVIEDRREHTATEARSLEQMPVTRGSDIAIDDFLIYMLDDGMRRQIIQRFTDVVRPLLANGTTIDIISHSWGTVVAYEGLRELEQQSDISGRVGTWFTVGSALSLPPVQWRLRSENRPGFSNRAPYPALVGTWINLDAQGDLVGGRLSRKFPVTKEYLDLLPVPCKPGFWGYELGCAHGSYFNPENLTVNQEIFAKYLLSA